MPIVTYKDLKEKLCCQEEKIKNDIRRSFTEHELFKENVYFSRKVDLNKVRGVKKSRKFIMFFVPMQI